MELRRALILVIVHSNLGTQDKSISSSSSSGGGGRGGREGEREEGVGGRRGEGGRRGREGGGGREGGEGGREYLILSTPPTFHHYAYLYSPLHSALCTLPSCALPALAPFLLVHSLILIQLKAVTCFETSFVAASSKFPEKKN